MSTLPWPSFWEHIPEADRGALGEILAELLGTGVLLGAEGRGRSQFILARDYHKEIAEYLAPLHLDLIEDLENSILQARPVPGDCGLTARFSKAETLLVLTLWRIYDDTKLNQITPIVLTSVGEIFDQWRLFFEQIEPPSGPQLERALGRLRKLRLIRMQTPSEVDRVGDISIEILPTLPRIIPFEDAAAWQQQAEIYNDTVPDAGDALSEAAEDSE